VLPVFESDAAHERAAHPLRRKRFATGTPVSTDGMRAGNAFLRRALFEAHRFDPVYARIGEDWDLFRRMARAGARFVWCDEARVDERVPAERLRLGWLSRRAFLGGATYARAESRERAISTQRLAVWSAAALAGALAAPIAALLGRSLGARVWLRACVQAGKLVGALRAPKPAARP